MRRELTVLGSTGLAAMAGALMLATSLAGCAQTDADANPVAAQQFSPVLPMQPLSEVDDPSTRLVAYPVEDSSGTHIGSVEKVMMSDDLKATTVNVSIETQQNNGKDVSIAANELRFDPNNNILQASLTQSQIQKLPAVPVPLPENPNQAVH